MALCAFVKNCVWSACFVDIHTADELPKGRIKRINSILNETVKTEYEHIELN